MMLPHYTLSLSRSQGVGIDLLFTLCYNMPMMKYITVRSAGAIIRVILPKLALFAITLMLTPHAYAASLPIVITNNVTNIAQSSATLWAIVDANGAPASFWFEYGTSYALGQRTDAQFSPNTNRAGMSADVGGLSANTTYYYRISAQNQFGIANGDVEKFTTAWRSGTQPIASAGTQGGASSYFGMPGSQTAEQQAAARAKTANVAQSAKSSATRAGTAVTSAAKNTVAKVSDAVTAGTATSTGTSTAPSAVASSDNKGSFLANTWKTIANIPGYVWFFTVLLIVILIVTYSFFRMLRGRASGEDDHNGHDDHAIREVVHESHEGG